MRSLIRRDFFRPMAWDPLAEFEKYAKDIWSGWEFPAGNTRFPYTDLVEEDGSIVIKSELPGVSPDEIDITLKDGVMTIKAEHHGNEEEGSAYQSLRYYRSMTLPTHIDAEKVSATMEHGLLEVRFPKAEALETKHVEVKALKEPKPKTTRVKRAKSRKSKKETTSDSKEPG